MVEPVFFIGLLEKAFSFPFLQGLGMKDFWVLY